MNPKTHSKRTNKSTLDSLFIRAGKQEDKGNFRAAFRLYLAAAKAGDRGCQLNLGNYYDDGTGVRRNRSLAFYWYKRAYRQGDPLPAHNIGVMWRNEGKLERALSWFKRSVKLGNEEAHLEIAKHYLQADGNSSKAIPHLRKVCQSNCVCEASLEEAAELLKEARRKLLRS